MIINSPYSASITGCSFLLYEFERILPLLKDPNSEILLREEIKDNQYLLVNSLSVRKRIVTEFKKRYNAAPAYFWDEWLSWSEEGKKAGYFYSILKSYKIVFDFHFNVTMRRWNSIEHNITKTDLMMEFGEISNRDPFVESWSEQTKNKVVSNYLNILRNTGLLKEDNELQPLKLEDKEFAIYIHSGEEWFLEACLLLPYEINDIKTRIL